MTGVRLPFSVPTPDEQWTAGRSTPLQSSTAVSVMQLIGAVESVIYSNRLDCSADGAGRDKQEFYPAYSPWQCRKPQGLLLRPNNTALPDDLLVDQPCLQRAEYRQLGSHLAPIWGIGYQGACMCRHGGDNALRCVSHLLSRCLGWHIPFIVVQLTNVIWSAALGATTEFHFFSC